MQARNESWVKDIWKFFAEFLQLFCNLKLFLNKTLTHKNDNLKKYSLSKKLRSQNLCVGLIMEGL